MYVNAGHNPPLVLRKNDEKARFLECGEIALGVIPEVKAVSHALTLEPGDILLMYTDGITEAFNEQDADFSEERLVAFLEKNRSLPSGNFSTVSLRRFARSGETPPSRMTSR